jgi:mRNA interferase MazF
MTTMPSMTAYNFGDVILVPFPFTDQAGAKQRPAVVVSSIRYNTERPDLILMAITSQVRTPATFGEVIVQHWQAAKLLKLSAIKPVFTTLDKRLVRKSLGRLHETDRASLKAAVQIILG